jgi:hypothetical protein
MPVFFIGAFEKLAAVIVVLFGIGVLVVAGAVMSGSGMMGPGGRATGGVLPGLLVLGGGIVYVLLLGGALYLILGIYHNTRRSAEALERMAQRQG